MKENNIGSFRERSFTNQINQTGSGFTRVDRVEKDSFFLGEKFYGLNHGIGWQGVPWPNIFAITDNTVTFNTTSDSEEFSGLTSEFKNDLFLNILRARNVDSRDWNPSVCTRNTNNHTGVGTC